MLTGQSDSKLGYLRFSLRDFLFIILYKIHIIIFVFVFIVTSTTIYALSATPLYMVSAHILLKPFFDSTQSLTPSGFLNVFPITQIDMNTAVEILYSRELALDVIRKLEFTHSGGEDNILVRLGISSKSTPEDASVKYITENLYVYTVTTSSAIRIEKKGENPEEITEIVNAYLECYIDRHIDIYKSINEISFYEDGVKEKRNEIEQLQEELSVIIKKYNIVNIEWQKHNNLGMLRALEENLSYILSDIAEKTSIIKDMKNNNLDVTTKEFRDAVFATLTSQYVSFLLEREKISFLYLEDSIEIKEINNQIKNISSKINEEKRKVVDGLSIELRSLQEKKKIFEKKIHEVKNELTHLSSIEMNYQNLINKIEQATKIYHIYFDKLEEERIKEQRNMSGISNISIISRAYVPSIPIFPKKTFMVAVAIIAGSIAAIGLGFVSYYIDNTAKEPKELIILCKAPVISLDKIKN